MQSLTLLFQEELAVLSLYGVQPLKLNVFLSYAFSKILSSAFGKKIIFFWGSFNDAACFSGIFFYISIE